MTNRQREQQKFGLRLAQVQNPNLFAEPAPTKAHAPRFNSPTEREQHRQQLRDFADYQAQQARQAAETQRKAQAREHYHKRKAEQEKARNAELEKAFISGFMETEQNPYPTSTII